MGFGNHHVSITLAGMVDVNGLRRHGDPFLLPLIVVMTQVASWICRCTSSAFKSGVLRFNKTPQARSGLTNNIVKVLQLPFLILLI